MSRQEQEVNLVLAFVLATAFVEDSRFLFADFWGGWNLLLLLLPPYRKVSPGNDVCNPGGSPRFVLIRKELTAKGISGDQPCEGEILRHHF